MAKKIRRRRFSAAGKVAILKRYLVGKEEVSAICDDLKLHPNQFYEWQRVFFEQGVRTFEADEKRTEAKLQAEATQLKAKLQRKDSVLSELMEEHLVRKRLQKGASSPWSRTCCRQISLMARPLPERQRPQRQNSSRLPGTGLGEKKDHRVL